MGNIPLFCWGDDFDPKVDKDGSLVEPPRKIAPERMKRSESRSKFRVNPETFFLFTV